MKYLLLAVIFSSSIFAQKLFPIKKMICGGYVENAPDELSENYYYAGAVIHNRGAFLDIYSCLGPSQVFVNEMIEQKKCGYSGIERSSLLKYKKINNKTYVYNEKRLIELVLGYKNSKNIYHLHGKYNFWGEFAPQMFYQVSCKAVLNE